MALATGTRNASTDRETKPRSVFHVTGTATGTVNHACGLRGGSAQKSDEPVFRNSNQRRRDLSCKKPSRVGRRSQDGACRLEPEKKKSMSGGVERDADTRYRHAGMWPRMDASEPQCTSVLKHENEGKSKNERKFKKSKKSKKQTDTCSALETNG